MRRERITDGAAGCQRTNKSAGTWRPLRHQDNRDQSRILNCFLKVSLFSTIQEESLSTEDILSNGAITFGKQKQCCYLSTFVWRQLGKASITVKAISAVDECQRLTDTTIMIVLFGWTTFHMAIADGYSGWRSQAERRKKESEWSGETKEWDDGLIEWIQIPFFSEEVGGDRTPQERTESEKRWESSGDNEVEKMRLR